MIPLRDDNPRAGLPVVTLGIIAACTLVFLWQESGQKAIDNATMGLSMVPARVSGDADVAITIQILGEEVRREIPPAWVPEWLTLFTCTFLHGGWLHLIGNVWVMWIFGDNVEERFGRLRFLAFYLGCGLLASLSHWVSDPHSPLPTVGASGAIAGVMGAYLLLSPHARVLVLLPLGLLTRVFEIPAYGFLLLWFGLQLLEVFVEMSSLVTGGVAWWAHIGGFVAGYAIAAILQKRGALLDEPVFLPVRPTAKRVSPPRRR